MKRSGELPAEPAPWRLEIPEFALVPASRWLDSLVQLPAPALPPEAGGTGRPPKGKPQPEDCALFGFSFALYSEENPAPVEDPPEEAFIPAAKVKGKK